MMPQKPHTKELVLGELLKSDNPNLRQSLALDGVKIGDVVLYPDASTQGYAVLLALSSSEQGKVLIAPAPCVVDLRHLPLEHFTRKPHGYTTEAGQALQLQAHSADTFNALDILRLLQQSALTYNIQYLGLPELMAQLASPIPQPQPIHPPPSPPSSVGSDHSRASAEVSDGHTSTVSDLDS